MVLNRRGADERRERLLRDIPTRAGFGRDEYRAAVGRGRANREQSGLVRGINPIGWMADVAYVPSGENRSHAPRWAPSCAGCATDALSLLLWLRRVVQFDVIGPAPPPGGDDAPGLSREKAYAPPSTIRPTSSSCAGCRVTSTRTGRRPARR